MKNKTFWDLRINKAFVFINQTKEIGMCKKVMLSSPLRFPNGSQYGYMIDGHIRSCDENEEVIDCF